MKCPICHKEVSLDSPQSPFFSKRCREIDLGNWAAGKYAIPGPSVDLPRPSTPDEEE